MVQQQISGLEKHAWWRPEETRIILVGDWHPGWEVVPKKTKLYVYKRVKYKYKDTHAYINVECIIM